MTSFDLFPNLPCELRLEIWKFAIRPAGRGVHRFSIHSISKDRSIHKDRGQSPATTDPNQQQETRHTAAAPRVLDRYSWTEGNDSAYLWDAGLWTACRESRDVMTWHFRVAHWHGVRRRLLRSQGQWTPAALADEFEDMTALTTARDGGREWHLMLRPHKDLFWLEPRDWKCTVEWQTLFLDVPFASFRRGFGHLSHVAVEHDASWNVDLPKDLGALLQEPTPRGFIARAMAECATNKLYCFVWLVDRSLVRRDEEVEEVEDEEVEDEEVEDQGYEDQGHEDQDHDDQDHDDHEDHEMTDEQDASSDLMTFYDCNRLYVDTDRADLQDDSDAAYEKTALNFVQLLGTIGNADYCLMGGDDEDFDFRVDEYLGVLACV